MRHGLFSFEREIDFDLAHGATADLLFLRPRVSCRPRLHIRRGDIWHFESPVTPADGEMGYGPDKCTQLWMLHLTNHDLGSEELSFEGASRSWLWFHSRLTCGSGWTLCVTGRSS